MMKSKTSLVVHDQILRSIILARDVKVILDADLATLDRVSTKVPVQAVKRNITRFPRAISVNIENMRAFVRLRQIIASIAIEPSLPAIERAAAEIEGWILGIK